MKSDTGWGSVLEGTEQSCGLRNGQQGFDSSQERYKFSLHPELPYKYAHRPRLITHTHLVLVLGPSEIYCHTGCLFPDVNPSPVTNSSPLFSKQFLTRITRTVYMSILSLSLFVTARQPVTNC